MRCCLWNKDDLPRQYFSLLLGDESQPSTLSWSHPSLLSFYSAFARFLFAKTWWPNSTARTEFGCPVLHTRLSLTETCVSDKPGQKPPVGRATKHILPVGVFLKLAISPSDSLIETLHRDAAESTCCSKHRRTQSPWGPGASISPTSGTTPSLALELPDCCLSAHEPE